MLCKYPLYFPKQPDRAAPCGSCLHCRINMRRVWSHRLQLESTLHANNSFLTLTYNDENLPSSFIDKKHGQVFSDYSVNPNHHRDFLKRLRERMSRFGYGELRFYAVGEYGTKTQRPHYHYCLFGFPPCLDLVRQKYLMQNKCWRPCNCRHCSFITSVWDYGHIMLGDLTHDSAQYVAGYVTKKMTSDKTDFQQKFLQGRHPEFARMSNRPGIARGYVDKIIHSLHNQSIDSSCDLPISLSHGGKRRPLGRYMRNMLKKEYGFDDEDSLRQLETQLWFMCVRKIHERSDIPNSRKTLPVPIMLEQLNAAYHVNLETKFSLKQKAGQL